jgi:hypothetical protein
MKSKTAVFIAALTGLWSFASAAVISGTVTDSGSGKSISNVYVTCGALSTVTDSIGNFTLNTVAGVTQSPRMRQMPRISWNPLNAVFSWQGYTGEVAIRVMNIQGLAVANYSSGKHDAAFRYILPTLAHGIYIASVSAGGVTGFYRILNLKAISGDRFQTMPLVNNPDAAGLAKDAAAGDTLTFSKAFYKTSVKVFTASQSGLQVKLQQDSANSGVSAGVTDSSGRVVLTLAGQSFSFNFADVHNVPFKGLSVGAQLNPDVPGLGVVMAAFTNDTRPPVIRVLRGSLGLSKRLASSKSADPAPVDVVDVSIKVGSFENSVAGILEFKSLPIPGAKTFLSGLSMLGQIGTIAKILNAIPGQPVSAALTEMGVGRTTTISAADALNEIKTTSNATSIILVGAAAVVNPLALPGMAVGIVVSKAANLFDQMTVSGCAGSVTKQTAGPYTFYSCTMRPPDPAVVFANAPIIKVSAAGGSLMELISKDNAGLGLTAAFDQSGNADVPVPLGRYNLQVQGPGIDPVVVSGISVSAGGGPIYVPTIKTKDSITYTGPFIGAAAQTLDCAQWKDDISATVSITVTGSGSMIDPYTGSMKIEGSYVNSVTYCVGTCTGCTALGQMAMSSPAGTVSGSSSTVEASGSSTILMAGQVPVVYPMTFTNGTVNGGNLTGSFTMACNGTGWFAWDAPITKTLTLTKK